MNSIFNNFKKDIESCFVDFLDSISTEYKLDNKEIKLRWEKFKGSESNDIIVPKEETEPIVIINETNANTCSYVFIKGKNSGSCCSNVTKNDNKYCTKHIKFETEDKKDKKKIIPKLADNKKMVLMNLQDTPYWWNKDTGLVFISSENKTVVAKYRDGQLNKLSEDDIKNCDKDNLKYDVNFNLDIKSEKPKEDDIVVVSNNKKKLIKSPILNDDDKKKKLEIYKTNACAKNIEDVLTNILNNDSDEDEDEDDFIDEEEEEKEDEEEKEEIRSENEDEEDLDLEEDDLDEEEEYLDEEM